MSMDQVDKKGTIYLKKGDVEEKVRYNRKTTMKLGVFDVLQGNYKERVHRVT